MRYSVTTLLLLLTTLAFGQFNFSKAIPSTDSTYGYAEGNPLKMKKGDLMKSIPYSLAFLKSLQTEDNQTLEMVKRYSIKDPNYDPPKIEVNNRLTGMSVGDGGILDKYYFITSIKKDTVILYVDVYEKGKLLIPKGLKLIAP